MVVSQIQASRQSPSSSSAAKLNQRKILEIKKKPTDFKHEKKNVKMGNTNWDMIRYEAKVSTTTDGNSCKVEASAHERAQEVRANLPANFPSFVKHMLKSHVTGGFWLGLPKPFCDAHLPKHDETVILVDENGDEYSTKYLFVKNGLSAGWRGFSLAHKLLEEDVLVFQLIHLCKFKVYIVRASRLTEIDGAIGLLNLDLHVNPTDTMKVEERAMISETAGLIDLEASAMEIHEEKRTTLLISDNEPVADRSGNESDEFEFGSVVMDGIRLSESSVDFKDVKGFEDFNIHVNGLILDSEIPQHLRTKYYELCCSQKMFLHDHLIEGLNSKLVAGMISETINIADAIRAAKITQSLRHLESWDKTLKAFEDLGMEVGFLRARLLKLVSLSRQSIAIIESKKHERAKAEEDIRDLEVKLLQAKRLMRHIENEIEALKKDDEKLAITFEEFAATPW
ncbi:B3 domain-containing Os01g0234100-like [Olea europaea subsp. europaea]|uniref:B3 domain-containing Os01g0234100-like n=2 Tax=Olea europaea subsp. europaea TaxID=158383 RepID=A0A8S0T9R9_OLEEU|nr:B3 domain-containing Os01g0234100-like [Olea europaea subsp. europaea]